MGVFDLNSSPTYLTIPTSSLHCTTGTDTVTQPQITVTITKINFISLYEVLQKKQKYLQNQERILHLMIIVERIKTDLQKKIFLIPYEIRKKPNYPDSESVNPPKK